MAILPTSNTTNPLSKNRIDLLATKNPLDFQLGGLGDPYGTIKQAIIYTQQNQDGPFNVPLNLNAPLIAVNVKASYNWDLSSVLKNAAIFPWVAIPTDGVSVRFLSNFIIPFQVQTMQIGKPDTVILSETLYAINSRLKPRLMVKGNFFSTLLPELYSFLETAPYQKKTSEKAPEYITFPFNISPCPSEIALKFQITSQDSRVETILYEKLSGVLQNQVLEINASFSEVLKLTTFDEIRYYNLFIYEVLADATERIIAISNTFYPDYDTDQEDEEVIIFKNQLGAWETTRFLGSSSANQEVSRLTFENVANELITYHTQFYEKVTLRTGALEQGWLRHIGEELITSNEIYLIRDEMKIRLQCTTDSLNIKSDENYDDYAEIEFRFAQTQNY